MSTSQTTSSGMTPDSLAIITFTNHQQLDPALPNSGTKVPTDSRAQSFDLVPSMGLPSTTASPSPSRPKKLKSKKLKSQDIDSPPEPPSFMPSRFTDEDSLHLRMTYGIPDDYPLLVPSEEQRPNTVPPPKLTFFSAQLVACLRFPLPPFFLALSNLYHIPLNPLE